MELKIQIKTIFGKVLFELEKENNTIRKTLELAIKQGADLRYANISFADLRDVNLSGADLRYANLRYADLSGADLRYANLRYANLSGADLRYANISFADLNGVNLSRTDLSGADLRYADLSRANLSGADLRYANISFADLNGVNLSRTDLSGVNLSRTGVSGAKNIKESWLPIFSKWDLSIKDDLLRIGCKCKTFEEWKEWFESSKEEFSTRRGSDDFKRLQACFYAYYEYNKFLNE